MAALKSSPLLCFGARQHACYMLASQKQTADIDWRLSKYQKQSYFNKSSPTPDSSNSQPTRVVGYVSTDGVHLDQSSSRPTGGTKSASSILSVVVVKIGPSSHRASVAPDMVMTIISTNDASRPRSAEAGKVSTGRAYNAK
ncbi:hypothetical protein TSPI_06495 [Trichinella spiralis]|uniref:Uncharacterized protein n=1 Tax=Trichinella spiralis TaxID=6334 RepID=A0ABR3L3K0_TRISP